MTATWLLAAWLAAQNGSDPCAAVRSQLAAAGEALERQDFSSVSRTLEPLESEHRDCPKVLIALGRLRYAQGEYLRANTYSELALLGAPGDPEAMVLRAQLLLMRNQAPEARVLLEKACRLAPNDAEAHYQLGMVHDGARRNQEAASEFRDVIRLRPTDARAYDYLALNLEPLGEIKEAEAAYRKALTVNQGPLSDPFLDYNYGRLLCKLNRLEECRRYLDRALEIAPQARAVRYEHARLNLRLERFREARDDAEKALALPDPGGFILDLQVYNLLVRIYSRLGDMEAARKYAQLSEQSSVPLRARERK